METFPVRQKILGCLWQYEDTECCCLPPVPFRLPVAGFPPLLLHSTSKGHPAFPPIPSFLSSLPEVPHSSGPFALNQSGSLEMTLVPMSVSVTRTMGLGHDLGGAPSQTLQISTTSKAWGTDL